MGLPNNVNTNGSGLDFHHSMPLTLLLIAGAISMKVEKKERKNEERAVINWGGYGGKRIAATVCNEIRWVITPLRS